MYVLQTLSVLPSTFFQFLKAALSNTGQHLPRDVTANNQFKVEAFV